MIQKFIALIFIALITVFSLYSSDACDLNDQEKLHQVRILYAAQEPQSHDKNLSSTFFTKNLKEHVVSYTRQELTKARKDFEQGRDLNNRKRSSNILGP
ncbi:MAG: hypothetical protein ACRYGR_05215 [Janthinobacterium lividum]